MSQYQNSHGDENRRAEKRRANAAIFFCAATHISRRAEALIIS